MKKFFCSNRWILNFVSNVIGYSLLAFLTGLVAKIPNNLVGGILAFDLVFLFIVFGSDDETLEIAKAFVTRKNIPPSAATLDGNEAKN